MLKHIFLGLALGTSFVPVSTAQSAADIAKASAGNTCENCNPFQAALDYSDIRNVSFAGSRLRQTTMTLAIMDGVNFTGSNLSIAIMYGGRFTGASFKNADLSRATLVGGTFDGADFTGAVLTGANLSGAELEKARGLTQTQLDMACGDASTRLPTGLSVQHCR